ncbi:MAG TPA: TIGR01777 family oxidoreductase [Candidatus Limnocylindrales bacterium]|nr:TIGR01777 family oxidoreductase [Candidatus Limnocylindrales bacterium]
MRRIVIAGGSGMIGRHLTVALLADGYAVDVLTRAPSRTRLPRGARAVAWQGAPTRQLSSVLAGAEAIVNLAGESIGPRPWTPARKRAIRDSRVRATAAIVNAVSALPAAERPRVLLSASGTDVYVGRDDVPATESTPPGDDFLARVCIEWEAAAFAAADLGVRVVIVRQAFVLAREAAVLGLMALPFRLFAGGPIGSGRQWFSWVHVDDLVALYRWALADDGVEGVINAAAPEPCRNADLAAAMGHVLGRPNWLPAPAWAVRLALRDQSTLVLGSRRAVPARALEAGFGFAYPELQAALREALGGR